VRPSSPPARRLLAAGIGYAVLVVVLSWPLVTRLGTAFIKPSQPGGSAIWGRNDLDLLAWILAWTAHALVAAPMALFQANIFHPAPDTLASSEHLIGLLPISAPVFLATGNAVLTYNVTTLVVIWLGAVFTYLLATEWSGRAAAGFLGGAIFALGEANVLSFVRVHVSAVALFPLVLLLAWRAVDDPRRSRLVALVLVTAVQLLAGIYVAFELLALLAAFVPALVWHARRRRGSCVAPLAAMALGGLVLVPVALPYLRVRAAGVLPDLETSLAIVPTFTPPVGRLWDAILADITWPGLVLAALGIASRSTPAEIRAALVSIGLVGFVLSLGPTFPGSPYEQLMRFVPGFAGMRAPSRFLVLTHLALAIAATMGAARLLRAIESRWRSREAAPGGGRRRLAAGFAASTVAAALLLVWVRARPLPLPIVRDPLHGVFMAPHLWLRDHAADGPVLDVPVANSALHAGLMLATTRAMLGSTLHWLPLLNGYSGHAPASHRLLMTLAQRLPDEEAFAEICALAAPRWIVAHTALMDDAEREAWRKADRRLPLKRHAEFDRNVIYEADCPPPTLRGALLTELSGTPSETSLLGTPMTPLPTSARRAELRAEIPTTLLRGELRWIRVDVENEGDRAWPGLSSSSSGVVRLQGRWRNPDGTVRATGEPYPLAFDLAPGRAGRAQLAVLVPTTPGEYDLEIGVEQAGSGWFAESGGSGVLRRKIRVQEPVRTDAAPSAERAA